MTSEFERLAEKVQRLAALTHALRRENAGLRMDVAALSTQNAELQSRMQTAHGRVAQLLDRLPPDALSPGVSGEVGQ